MIIWAAPCENVFIDTCAQSDQGFHIHIYHYENMPIQIYYKIYHQKKKKKNPENFQIKKILIYFILLLKT